MSTSRPGDRDPRAQRTHGPDIGACVLAAAAMLDGWFTHLLAPVFWGALLIVGAMTVAAVRRRNRVGSALVAYHPALGLLVMALLQFASITATPGGPDLETGPHDHGGSSAIGVVGVIAPLAGVALAVLTVFALARARTAADRVTLATLGATVILTAGSMVGR